MNSRMPREMDWSIRSVRGAEKPVMSAVREAASTWGADSERCEEIATAVSEACLNAMEHGNGLNPDRIVGIMLRSDPCVLAIRISDEGGGFMFGPDAAGRAEERYAADDPRGWGMTFIAAFADEFHLSRQDGLFSIELLFTSKSRERLESS